LEYLLDTSVLSLLAPGRTLPNAGVTDWLRERSDELYISTVSITEIAKGIHKLKRVGGAERAERLSAWLDRLVLDRPDRVLSFDIAMARKAGQISDRAIAMGRHPGFADVAIAATAAMLGLVILTRNGRHFEPLEVEFIDPTDSLT
jgi:predicted nucleic acid-binding protein